jgi:hypothetical protein
MPASLFNIGRYINKPKINPPQEDASLAVPEPTASPDNDLYGDIAPAPDLPTLKHVQDAQPMSSSKIDNPVITPRLASTEPTKPQQTPPSSPAGQAQSAGEFQKRAGMDILSRLTQRSNKVLVAAVSKAKESKSQFVDTEHVLWGLLQDPGIYQFISDFKVAPTELLKVVEEKTKKGQNTEPPKFSPRVKKVLELSFPAARAHGYEFISPEHILIGLLKEGEGLAAQILSQFGVTVDKLEHKVAGKKAEEKEEKSSTAEFTTDLTALAREGKLDPVVSRAKEI